MADSRFFCVAGPFTLQALAEIAGAEVAVGCDPQCLFTDVASLDSARSSDFSFLDNKKYVNSFTRSNAGGCVVHPSLANKAPQGMSLLLSDNPYRSYALIAQAFYPVVIDEETSIAPTACIDPSARLGERCRVEAGAVIGRSVEIGNECLIGANTVIGDGVVIGNRCRIGSNVSLSHCLIGNLVVLFPGVRIGQDGFGYAMGPQGHLKIPQLGRVIIEDDVEIGANTTIDRGAGPDTVIGTGCRIDNLVQIGHNVRLGRGCVIVSQAGISGSTHLGNFVVMGGQAGMTGHLKIGDGVQIAAQSGVMRDIPPMTSVGGAPAAPIIEWMRQNVALAKLARNEEKGKKGSHE